MLMEVVKRVRVRTEPRVANETMLEWLEPGSRLEVDADIVEEADNFVWRQHADTGNWSAEKEADGTLYLLEVIQPYVAIPPETVAPETVKMSVVAAANIRSEPTTNGADVGDLSQGEIIEVFPGERTISDDYVWLRHSDNRWSVQVKMSSGQVYLERVAQEGLADKLTSGIDVQDLIDDSAEPEPKTTTLMDVVQKVEARKLAQLASTVMEELAVGAQVEVKIDVIEEADGHQWRQQVDTGYWVPEKQVEGGVFLLEVLEPQQPADPDTPIPETVKMQVVTDVRIRDNASLDANRIGSIKAGKFIDVYPQERSISGNYVWLRHAENQWSAQIAISDGEVYLERVDDAVLNEISGSGLESAGDYGLGFRSVFQQLPLSLADTMWFYYFGNTVVAYKCRDIYGYGYARGLHAGLDFGTTKSATIVAGVDGIVTKIETKDPYNHKVWVKTEHNIVIYQHIWNEKVTVGQTVAPGSPVAEVRPTTNQGLNHLHLEVRDGNGSEIYNPLMMMPASMSSDLILKYPAEKSAAFLTKFGQYLEPLDQPIIKIDRTNYDNPMVPNGFLSQGELDAIPYGC